MTAPAIVAAVLAALGWTLPVWVAPAISRASRELGADVPLVLAVCAQESALGRTRAPLCGALGRRVGPDAVSQAYAAARAFPAGAHRPRGGCAMKRPSDKALVAALRRHRGNTTRAAAELGIARSTLRVRAARIAEAVSIIADREYDSRPRRYTDAEILAAIEKHGSQAAAARALGYTKQAVSFRVQLIRAGGVQ